MALKYGQKYGTNVPRLQNPDFLIGQHGEILWDSMGYNDFHTMDITTIKWDIWRAHEGKHWISDDDDDDVILM